ncbi:hypothetical protein L1I30_06040 [Gillisia sp. M10.2A]|uniref:Thioredoxin domain-containing protein n=1 Tax=Gillisia lutea TaxID=2909668 RepID=A0ABS9EEB4_9FLAO|nr:hypothetical protein [Gillisia lutea]MCF4101217.1 hypothetical protein [Gillisia lutea]
MKYKIILLSLFLVGLTACNEEKDDSEDIYVSGQIANPSSKYVIISKDDIDLDTLLLNSSNQFHGVLKNPGAGLFVFKHAPENQIMYMEPGDSILVWVNTLAFDESINFSGKGAEKSNFLTNMYLLNQQNNDLILSYYKLEPSKFAAKTDSIKASRLEELKQLEEKNDFSDDFYELAHSSINYEYYDLRERYAFLIRKYSREYVDNIPTDFHAYRKDISFNDQKLADYYVYLNLIDDYLRNKALDYCDKNDITDKSCYNLNDYNNIKRRIILIDSLIQNKNIRNTFLDRLAAQGIIYSQNKEDIQAILNLLEEIKYTGNLEESIQDLARIQTEYLPGNSLGDRKYLNMKGETVLLRNISRKPMISYRWSTASQAHHKWQHEIIDDLRFKYPEIDFIGINLDKNQFENWTTAIENYSYDPKFEYKATLLRVDQKLLKNYLNKLIFMDASGKIIKGDVRLDSPDLETKILEFLSQQ